MSYCHHPCITEAISDLQEQGFVLDFCLHGDRLFCPQLKIFLRAGEFEILQMHYFPRNGESAGEKMLYGIEAPAYLLKGVLLISGKKDGTAFPDMINRKLEDFVCRSRHVFDNGIL